MKPTLLIAVIATAASMVIAPAASATDRSLSVSPSPVEPGGTITFTLRGCDFAMVPLYSDGIEGGSTSFSGGNTEKRMATAKVVQKEGTHEVNYYCKSPGFSVTTKFVIAKKKPVPPSVTTPAPPKPKPAKPQVVKKPKGGAETGAGLVG
jgi:hypothetical protein